MKVAFATLGCRVNLYETEAMMEKFIKEGYEVVEFEDFADVYVINTCTVTNTGDKKSRQMIRRAKKKNEESIVAVVGCYAQIAPEEISSIQGVDVILGTRNKGEIIYWVNRVKEEKEQMIVVKDVLKNNSFEDLNIQEYQDKTRAFLKIQDGCNRFCSYCLIPFARGAVCSKKPERVLEEVKKLSEHGFKEIILSGIHIASYGNDLEGNWDLTRILEEINKVHGIQRIRIGSIDPTFFTEEVIKKAASIEKLCPHFHLSLQSGCDETLKRMNRRYTAKEYEEAVDNLRKYIKDVSITTDVIVGFPGETEEEFSDTYNFLKHIELSKMHIFKYSPRKGTKAAQMPDQVDGNIKEERSSKLISLDKELENKFISRFIGREMNVLFEQNVHGNDNLYEGYTENYIKVLMESEEDIKGKIVRVTINSAEGEHALGKEIKPKE
ncbi:tRNA (N(6)-L-threonylcarbamoyladenosine(37)-C(2))-methylthiotransferase MtaB [Haloimpatiens massiliensis]|uniref:tRNA (N(6)-L-threonylcarbamoyladenosine(37)-C(2))- methylthiotransferase MtaB n=1 Tax=Haloimpatiens massiliensis TaxID=1658110 RepID=UPI000C866966|nr:tRNA (N(6)-L-threonylcarbamoyladenosine(37)-C(2))-methylthiotransferase MtaB [Haloimpatiens massiliensis]